MDSEHFTIRGATGVDLDLPLAGPGSRSYAFVIDWHIRLLVALAFLAAALVLVNGSLTWRSDPGKSGTAAMFLIVLPPLLIYFFYHPVLEILMRGQTPGKRLAGVRVVSRDGGIPSIGAILIRNVFRLVDSLPSFYVVGLWTTFLSAQRLRIGDMAAGTMLVLDQRVAPAAFLGLGESPDFGGVDLVAADLAAQILERWPQLAEEKRGAIARTLLARVGGPTGNTDGLDDAGLKTALAALARGGASS
jgi:uncharacterized RDD family membrane protein YckC